MVNFDVTSPEVTISMLKVEAADHARHSIVMHRLNPQSGISVSEFGRYFTDHAFNESTFIRLCVP